MKTPRELLFGRHQSTGPRLDQMRENIVDQIRGAGAAPGFTDKLWRELFWPVRQAWLGLGAAWVIILALHLATGGETLAGVNSSGPMAPDSVIALQRQEWLMAQSVADDMAAPLPSKPAEQGPRSEAPVPQKIV